jgi:hypothetical protein
MGVDRPSPRSAIVLEEVEVRSSPPGLTSTLQSLQSRQRLPTRSNAPTGTVVLTIGTRDVPQASQCFGRLPSLSRGEEAVEAHHWQYIRSGKAMSTATDWGLSRCGQPTIRRASRSISNCSTRSLMDPGLSHRELVRLLKMRSSRPLTTLSVCTLNIEKK